MLRSSNKIIRSVCYFTKELNPEVEKRVDEIVNAVEARGFELQTKRICSPQTDIQKFVKVFSNFEYLGIGTLSRERAGEMLSALLSVPNVYWNLDLTQGEITLKDAEYLFEIIKRSPQHTFNFTYVFLNAKSSPYFPSASYEQDGFSIGFQPTDLSESVTTLEQWFEEMDKQWREINDLFSDRADWLGIDSSIAPLFSGKSSLINFIKRLGMSFDQSVTTDTYTRITKYIKENNPKLIGLNGLMLPCLEDFELAEEYERGNFSIERNLFLSLHSGLGIDTYPIGINEEPKRVLEILKLLQALSKKYNKSLSARFVSDGQTKIGEKSDFKNQYLKDVVIRPL